MSNNKLDSLNQDSLRITKTTQRTTAATESNFKGGMREDILVESDTGVSISEQSSEAYHQISLNNQVLPYNQDLETTKT